MDDHEYTSRIEVLRVVDTGRRRRWTDEEKLRIVAESHCAGANLSDVARRHEISRAQLYEWRYPGFAPGAIDACEDQGCYGKPTGAKDRVMVIIGKHGKSSGETGKSRSK